MLKKTIVYALSAALITLTNVPVHADDDNTRTVGQVIDDVSIAGRTKAALAADPITDAINIDIEVDKDKVQLNGFVDSDVERERAESIAKAIKGVASVENNLQIQPEDRMTGEYIDDKILIVKVKSALADDPVAHSLKIDVEVNHGVVSLGGYVDSEAERVAAVQAAESVDGVFRVVNNLNLRS